MKPADLDGRTLYVFICMFRRSSSKVRTHLTERLKKRRQFEPVNAKSSFGFTFKQNATELLGLIDLFSIYLSEPVYLFSRIW